MKLGKIVCIGISAIALAYSLPMTYSMIPQEASFLRLLFVLLFVDLLVVAPIVLFWASHKEEVRKEENHE